MLLRNREKYILTADTSKANVQMAIQMDVDPQQRRTVSDNVQQGHHIIVSGLLQKCKDCSGEKGFDGVITALQMQTYLCVRDFRQRKNKKGEAYGWPVAVYCTPEHLWGRDHVTSAYTESAASSGEKNRSAHAGNLPDCNQTAGTSVGGEYCCTVIHKNIYSGSVRAAEAEIRGSLIQRERF